jgi:hypothetical protein
VSGADTDGRQEALHLAYEQVCKSYEGITEFRGKLLTLLPLATGTGAFLLLDQGQSPFLGAVGLFGVVVTFGLFAYELRGIQRCHHLEFQAEVLERELELKQHEGQFWDAPRRLLGDMLGPPLAGLVVYLAVATAWLYVAGFGFDWWNEEPWGLLIGYVGALALGWAVMKRYLMPSPPQATVLEVLRAAPGSTPAMVAEAAGIPTKVASATISRLVEQGWVRHRGFEFVEMPTEVRADDHRRGGDADRSRD